MAPALQWIVRFAVRNPMAALVLSVLVGSFFLFQIPRIQTIDNVDYFIVDDDPDFAYYQEIRSFFGEDEFFVVAFSQPDVFTRQNLELLQELTEYFQRHAGIRDVRSLASVDYVDGAQEYFDVRPFLETIPDTPATLSVLREQALSTPLYLDNLLSRDGRTAAVIVFPYEFPDDAGFRKRLLQEAAELLGRLERDDLQFHLAGNTVSNVHLSQAVQRDLAVFIPLTYLLVALVMMGVFRSIQLTILGMVSISVCVGSTIGFMALLEIPMHNLTSVIPSLAMALALADTVHIFSRLEAKAVRAFQSWPEALEDILGRLVMPCFLTSLTTAVGFLSLSVSDIQPIREFAYVAAMGMVFKFFFSFLFLAPLLALRKPAAIFRDKHEYRRMSRVLTWISALVRRHYVWVNLVFLAVLVASIGFSSRIQVETNLVEYFKQGSTLRKDLDFVQQNLSGVAILDLSLRGKEIEAFAAPEHLQLLDRIQSFLLTLDGVDATLSFADFVKDMHKSFHDEDPEYHVIPDDANLIAQYLLLYDSSDIDDYITPTFDHARIMVRLSETSSAKQAELIQAVQEFLDHQEAGGIAVRITGNVVQQVNVIQALVRGLFASLAIAVVVIGAVMLFALGSVKIGLLSLIPNLFPLVMTFGFMGLLGIPLDTSTALIAVVALGIAVDDTIHFLTEYNSQRSMNRPVSEALHQAILLKGMPIIATSIILAIGFGVLVFSSFIPTIYFGLLSIGVMLTALVGDLFLLPAVMLLRNGAERG
ncbi:efflux RND transporter permease subunit [Desulfonatronum thioautotrophicum]|uniref:efflux RND transporter permease subunit n=1 Tax=Desulfonatronum thioautotrophicum TaxID=617001 RepID=UPI000699D749|nr:MMPL family transporter [Desulfonatronum thioautotrophicum]